jgi:dsDNA-specific endonuclease/ATPase MutS2
MNYIKYQLHLFLAQQARENINKVQQELDRLLDENKTRALSDPDYVEDLVKNAQQLAQDYANESEREYDAALALLGKAAN